MPVSKIPGAGISGGSIAVSQTAPDNSLVVDSSGNVGIGTSSPNEAMTIQRGAGVSAATTYRGNGVTSTGEFYVGHGSDAIAYVYNRANQPLIFATNNIERARIISSGSVKMTTTGNYRNNSAPFYEMNINNSNEIILELTNEASTNPFGQRTRFSAASPNNTTQYFYNAVDSTTSCFTIWSNGTTSGRSDERLKKNIADASPKLDDICKLKVRNYEWKESDNGTKEIGLVAQEVEQVFPNLVITHDVEKQGDDYKEVKYSVFVPILIKAMQEQQQIINDLKARIETLEAK